MTRPGDILLNFEGHTLNGQQISCRDITGASPEFIAALAGSQSSIDCPECEGRGWVPVDPLDPAVPIDDVCPECEGIGFHYIVLTS